MIFLSQVHPKLILVTGMSGAGKTVAIDCLEDLGYYCIDNMPPSFLEHIHLLSEEENLQYNNIRDFAIVVDSRSLNFDGILTVIHDIKERNDFDLEVIFLDCNDEVLMKRFKETRRVHPLQKKGSISEGIVFERLALRDVKELADYVIDTSYISANQLKREILKRFAVDHPRYDIHIMSFGFKHGTPMDCDYIFDVRFLPNPFYEEDLRPLTGEDEPVYDYVIRRKEALEYIDQVVQLMEFVIPRYENIAKKQVLIGIGCSGGQHRSVAIARKINEELSKSFHCNVWHRDIEKIKR